MAGQISGNGFYTRKCHALLEKKYGFRKVLLTTSCTDALEMAALLADIQPGDEVIMPSFTFVSTANAFVLRGAKIVFVDSNPLNPNINAESVEELITPRTRAIVVIHYSGIACDMEKITDLAKKYNLFLVEDAAHAIDSFYKDKPLGSIGHFGTFSFHETKNVMSGEGGALIINDERFIERAEIIWEKGTNRVAFKRGDVRKYEWVDIGSSYLPSEIIAGILHAQLSELKKIQKQRVKIWYLYHNMLRPLEISGKIRLPHLPEYATVNGHMYYVISRDLTERNNLIRFLAKYNIHSVFHYLPLHLSPYYREKHDGRDLPMAQFYSDTIVRLPFYYELLDEQVEFIAGKIYEFYR